MRPQTVPVEFLGYHPQHSVLPAALRSHPAPPQPQRLSDSPAPEDEPSVRHLLFQGLH
ncbi:hypothetical protein [Nostoc sp.]|uniref:hypothetical protein n=1 Tax=Nostoc sp. TaxID=1180 RepID=UPI002FF55FBE